MPFQTTKFAKQYNRLSQQQFTGPTTQR